MPKRCDRPGCLNDAAYSVALLLRADERSMPAEGQTGLVVCSYHRAFMGIEDALTDEGWEAIVAGFRLAKMAVPARHLTRVLFQKLPGEGKR